MDPLLQFLSWQFMLFCLCIAGVTYILRTIIEFYVKNVKSLTVWEELILPIFPIVIGGITAGLITMYPYPAGLTSTPSRIIFGSVAGLLSTVIFRFIKSMLSVRSSYASSSYVNSVYSVNSINVTQNDSTLEIDPNLVNTVRDSIQKNND